jgi:hypothetical protein
MRAFIYGILFAFALNVRRKERAAFRGGAQKSSRRIETHEHTGDFKEFSSNRVRNANSVGPRGDCFSHNQGQ